MFGDVFGADCVHNISDVTVYTTEVNKLDQQQCFPRRPACESITESVNTPASVFKCTSHSQARQSAHNLVARHNLEA